MNRLVFPENVGPPPRSKRPLQLKHLLAVVYIYAGFSGLIYVLSKFIVNPLFEQLTFDRRLLAEETRDRLTQLNAALSRAVSKVPPITTSSSKYVEVSVQSEYSSTAAEAESSHRLTAGNSEIVAMTDSYVASLRELKQLVQGLDPNSERQTAQSNLTGQATELAKYARQVQYEAVPSGLMGFGFSPASRKDGEKPSLAEAVVDCKLEIRALKSNLLSGK